MRKEEKLERLMKRGFLLFSLGKNIKAVRGEEVYKGSVSYVHKRVFGY